MSLDDTFTIQLVPTELAFVGALLQLPGLPIQEESVKEQDASQLEFWEPVQTGLSEKEYARLPEGEDEAMMLDQTVAGLVSVLGYPEKSLSITTFRDGEIEPDYWYVFLSQDLIVDLHQEPDEQYAITAVRTSDVAVNRIGQFLKLNQQPAASESSFRLSDEEMSQIPYIIAGNGPVNGAAFLQEKGAEAETASQLAKAIDKPVCQSLLQTFIWEEGTPREIGRLTILEELYGLWLIRPVDTDGESYVEIVPVDAVTAGASVSQLVNETLTTFVS